MNKLPLLCLLLLAPSAAVAQEKPKIAVSAALSTGDLLKAAMSTETRVVVTLKNGTSFHGWVKEVSAAAVVLKNVQGKEFYEQYVVLSEVAVVEVRVKG